ncbi:MAG: hypothetical protein ACQER1_03900 [Armatimonadota bacterium]
MRRFDLRPTAMMALAVVLLTGCLTAPALAQNLLRNGGFEGPVAGDAPQGWAFRDLRDDDLASAEVTTKNPAFGRHSLMLEAPSFPADFAAFCLPVDVDDIESDEVFVSCSYRTESNPQALLTLAAYGEDFTEREFATPELHSESHPLGETGKWHSYTTTMTIPPGTRQIVLFLRITGEGKVWWDGVNLRPVGGEIEADLQQGGIIERMPDQRSVRCRVNNVTDREMNLSLETEATEAGKKRVRRGKDSIALAPGRDGVLEITYPYAFDEPHDLRVMLRGDEPDVIYADWQRTVPGLVDARIIEPAFRNTIVASVPTERVVVEGTLNALPEITRSAELEAMIVGTGERTAEVETLSGDGLAGRWRMTLPPDGMLTQTYIVQVTASVDGREYTQELPLHRAPHATAQTAYDAQKRLWINGEPVFPVGIYRVGEEKDLPTVADAGFNFCITPSRQLSFRYAAAARDAGIHVVLSSDTLDGQFWEYMAQKYHENPAMIGWSGLELPDTRMVTYDNLYQAYRQARSGPYPAIAEADPHHPIVLALRPNASMSQFAELADIVMAWSEPVPHQPLTAVARSVRAAREAVADGKPVWAVIQSSGYQWVSELSPTPPPTGRPPTAAEHRAMVYLALMAGADGVVNYAWSLPAVRTRSSYYLPRDEPDLWAGIVETNRQLEWLAPALINDDPEHIDLSHDAPVQLAAWDREGDRIVVAVNTEDTTAAIGFDVGARAGEEVEVLFEDRCVIATDDGELGDIFEPYAVHIYQIGG